MGYADIIKRAGINKTDNLACVTASHIQKFELYAIRIRFGI